MEDNVRFATCPAQVSGTVKPWKVPFIQSLDFEILGGGGKPLSQNPKTNRKKN